MKKATIILFVFALGASALFYTSQNTANEDVDKNSKLKNIVKTESVNSDTNLTLNTRINVGLDNSEDTDLELTEDAIEMIDKDIVAAMRMFAEVKNPINIKFFIDKLNALDETGIIKALELTKDIKNPETQQMLYFKLIKQLSNYRNPVKALEYLHHIKSEEDLKKLAENIGHYVVYGDFTGVPEILFNIQNEMVRHYVIQNASQESGSWQKAALRETAEKLEKNCNDLLQKTLEIKDLDKRDDILVSLISGMSENGLKLVHEIKNPLKREEALFSISKVFASGGETEKTLEVLANVTDQEKVNYCLSELAKGLAQRYKPDKGMEIIANITNQEIREDALKYVAPKFANENLEYAFSLLEQIEDINKREIGIKNICNEIVINKSAKAIELAKNISDSNIRDQAINQISVKYFNAESAYEIIPFITEDKIKTEFINLVALDYARTDVDKALKYVNQFSYQPGRDDILSSLSHHVVSNKEVEKAKEIAELIKDRKKKEAAMDRIKVYSEK